MYCECVITNTILYNVYSRSRDTLCLIRHHSTVNSSTIPIVPKKFEGLFNKWLVHSSAPVHIIYLLSLSCRRLQILLIFVWKNLCIFLGMISKKVFISACLRGFFLSLLSISLPLHSEYLVMEELVAILVLI